MKYPISTGHAAKLLGITEPQLAETVRRGRVQPEPAQLAGRRLWEREQILQAAEHLGILTNDLRLRLSSNESEVVRG